MQKKKSSSCLFCSSVVSHHPRIPASLLSRVYTSIPPHTRCFSHSHSPVLVARSMHKLHAQPKPHHPSTSVNPSHPPDADLCTMPCTQRNATQRTSQGKENKQRTKKKRHNPQKERNAKINKPIRYRLHERHAMPCHAQRGQSGKPARERKTRPDQTMNSSLPVISQERHPSIHPCPIHPSIRVPSIHPSIPWPMWLLPVTKESPSCCCIHDD